MGLTRTQLFGLLGNLTVVEPIILSAYENEEYEIWKEDNSRHTSFHSSSFPGSDDSVCGRAQIYSLMNPASEKPFEPKVRGMFDQGTDIEHRLVERLSRYGVLLSADVTGEDEYQTNFIDTNCWLSGSPDAIILPPFWTKGHVIDVKSTSHDKVISMKADPSQTIYSHQKYLRQLKAYIAEAHKKFSPTVVVCQKSGLLIKNGKDKCAISHKGKCRPSIVKVEPPDDGTLFYVSREEPVTATASYYVSHDPGMIVDGKKKLLKWKEYFLQDEIAPHVREGESAKWSEGECRYCNWKKPFCKKDYANKTKKLSESALVEHTKKIRKNYDPAITRKAVLDRWGVE